MKKTQLLPFLALALLSLASACTSSPEGEKAEAGAALAAAETGSTATTYTVAPAETLIEWTASKVGGQHNGTLNVSAGEVSVDGGNLAGGSFTLDMNSIKVLDLEGEWKQKLEGHLRSGDFFEAEKFPTGTFTIAKVEPIAGDPQATHIITGNLSLKGIEKSVSFKANVSVSGSQVTAKSVQFVIDRMEWDIKYKSGLIGTPKDEIINDNIGLQITLVANSSSPAPAQ